MGEFSLEQEVARLKAALSWIDESPHGNKMLWQGEIALDNILKYITELEKELGMVPA